MTYHIATVHPFDPWGTKIGGIETLIRSTLQYAPAEDRLSVIGVTEDSSSRPSGEWHDLSFEGKTVSFFPIMEEDDPNRRRRIPLFLRFSIALQRRRLSLTDAVVLYHRVEPLAVGPPDSLANALFIHGDPREMTGQYSEVRWRHIPWVYRWVEARAVTKAHQIYVVNREGSEFLKHQYPSKKDTISFLPTWYNPEVFFPVSLETRSNILHDFNERWRLDPKLKCILFAGRFEKQKDPLLALESFALIVKQEPDARLLLVGEGGLWPQMKERIQRLAIDHYVHYLGKQPPNDLADLMRISRLLLLTSRFEGMPIIILEALACGLPVVSTDTGEVASMIIPGETGEIVTDYSPASIADTTCEVLRNPIRYAGEQCVKAVEPHQPGAAVSILFNTLRNLHPSS